MNTISTIEKALPDLSKYNRYIEVMFGSGYSFTMLTPSQPALINDANTDLINFYKNLLDPELQTELQKMAEGWNLIGKFSKFSNAEIIMAFNDLENDIISNEDIFYFVRAIVLMNMTHDAFSPLIDKNFVASTDLFQNSLIKTVVNALIKLKGTKSVSDNDFNNQVSNSIETAFRSGFYEHFKSLINWQRTEIIACLSLQKHLAAWYFIKELGKDKHLYYDNNGNLKNHYGGLDFNTIDFQTRIAETLDPQFLLKLENAKLFNQNPIDFINEAQVTPKDIVVINLTKKNLVLANGKNYLGLGSQLDQIKQIIKLEINLILLTDDQELANELISLTGKRFQMKRQGDLYIIL